MSPLRVSIAKLCGRAMRSTLAMMKSGISMVSETTYNMQPDSNLGQAEQLTLLYCLHGPDSSLKLGDSFLQNFASFLIAFLLHNEKTMPSHKAKKCDP